MPLRGTVPEMTFGGWERSQGIFQTWMWQGEHKFLFLELFRVEGLFLFQYVLSRSESQLQKAWALDLIQPAWLTSGLL